MPGVLYTAGVKHANNVAAALRDAGINAQAVSGETPKRELAEILAGFERGDVDVLCNAMLLAEGWNSPRATICMHLAPTASRRVYQQRVGRVTRRAPGKEAGLVIDFVHPATTSDETIVTLHSLLDRDVYRGGAIVVGPVRRGRGRRVRVERRVVPVAADPERRLAVLERELWRIAVENLNYSEQHAWAALAGARVTPNQWRRAKAMIQHDEAKELRRRFLLTCVQRNRNHQLRLKALAEVAALRDAEAFDDCVDIVATWGRDDRRSGAKALLQALAERRIGRRDQAQAWVWRLAGDHPRAPRAVRGPALARDQAPPRPVRQLLRPRSRPQRAPPRDRRPPAGPAPVRLAARRGRRPHARGRGGPARRPDADGPQALGRRPRAAAELPEARARSAAGGARARATARRERREGRAAASGEAREARGRRDERPSEDSRDQTKADLARAEGDPLARGGLDDQVAARVDPAAVAGPRGFAAGALPAHRAAAQRVALAERRQPRRRAPPPSTAPSDSRSAASA